MTQPDSRWHLLAYDIRDARRAQRLRYRLRKCAAYLQESVALARLDDDALAQLIESLAPLLRPGDDLRAYAVRLDEVWLAGPNPLPGMRMGQPPTRQQPPSSQSQEVAP